MTTLPTLSDLHPSQWVQAMRRIRNEVAEEAASVLDRYEVPADAHPELQAIFNQFTQIDVNTPALSRLEAVLAVEIRPQHDSLVFWVFPTEAYQSIVFTRPGYWQIAPAAGGGAHRTGQSHTSQMVPGTTNSPDFHDKNAVNRHEVHRELACQLLKLIPWANDDALAEIAAIEIASRAG